MLTREQKEQFSEILEKLGESLDITKSQYDAAVESYGAVARFLADKDSPLNPYFPAIRPQGSFMLGTMIQPICKDDDLDIDLVCELSGKNPNWTQADLKKKIGDRLKERYGEMLDEEGRRCWTLLYRENALNYKSKYHMDVLPSIVATGYAMVLEKAFSESEYENLDNLAIRITDKQDSNYRYETNSENWRISNPFGYGRWFFQQAQKSNIRKALLSETIQEVPQYTSEKLPLQRVIQILKRHRDMMFNGKESKPISIIITTLSARAYNGESNVLDALVNVIEKMEFFIEERFSFESMKKIKWIPNPVNSDENFADRWEFDLERERCFFIWLEQVKADVKGITEKRGVSIIKEALEAPFGKDIVEKAFSKYGDLQRQRRESGLSKMAADTGFIGTIGTSIPNHNFHGR
ncbi:MAG: nucleotidyltransferase [Gelidibacter sp.]|nr:nucleotidyltransferase [Saprospiraceae bacterium]